MMGSGKERALGRIDLTLFIPMTLLAAIGVLFVYSSGVDSAGKLVDYQYVRQMIWVAGGLGLFFFFAYFDYGRLRHAALFIYLACVALLILVLIAGTRVYGAKAWLGFGSFGVQPSEFAKVGVVLLAAVVLETMGPSIARLSRWGLSAVVFFLPVVFIALQPDFGSSTTFFALFMVMTFVAGARVRNLAFIVLVGALFGVFLLVPLWNKYMSERQWWVANVLGDRIRLLQLAGMCMIVFLAGLFAWLKFKLKGYALISYIAAALICVVLVTFAARIMLKEYQWQRLATFLNPYLDPKKSGWQVIQSLTAVGSGGGLGKGFLNGTQSHYRFLPEQSTDFIFSIILEEAGFLGGFIVLTLYAIILARLLFIKNRAKDKFGELLCAGAFTLIAFHLIINVGMVVGLTPVTGIPLLLLSYGGSSTWMVMSLLGLSMSVSLRRTKN